jgi:hypothetical protein
LGRCRLTGSVTAPAGRRPRQGTAAGRARTRSTAESHSDPCRPPVPERQLRHGNPAAQRGKPVPAHLPKAPPGAARIAVPGGKTPTDQAMGTACPRKCPGFASSVPVYRPSLRGQGLPPPPCRTLRGFRERHSPRSCDGSRSAGLAIKAVRRWGSSRPAAFLPPPSPGPNAGQVQAQLEEQRTYRSGHRLQKPERHPGDEPGEEAYPPVQDVPGLEPSGPTRQPGPTAHDRTGGANARLQFGSPSRLPAAG